MRVLQITTVVCLWIFGLGAPVSAGVYNYFDVMVGGRAAQMGGAFTALADDATAAYFNPAGLSQMTTPSFSISANGLDLQTYTIAKRFFGKDIVYRSNAFYPTAWAIVRSFGEYRLAFSAMVPSNLDVASKTNFGDVQLLGQTLSVGFLDSRLKDRVYLVGPSLSYRLGPTLMIGGTVYYWYGETLTENSLFFGGSPGESQVGRFNRISGVTQGLLGQAGLLMRPSDFYSIGLVLRAPVLLNQEIDIQDQVYSFDAQTGLFSNSFSQSKISQSAHRPAGGTAGLAFYPKPGRTVSMDVTYYGNTRFAVSSRTVVINPVWNAAIGYEETVLPKIPIRVGFYTNRSAAPELDRNPTAQDDPIDYYGATVGFGYIDKLSTFDAGVRYALGSGQSKDPSTGERFDVRSHVMTVFVSGSVLF